MRLTRSIAFLAFFSATLIVPAATAQDRPTVFIHGLGASSDSWHGAAGRLSQTLAISYAIPQLEWHHTYDSQTQELNTNEPDVGPGSHLAIGHSNGGVIARLWARQRPLTGIVTIGTPHQGTPFVTNAGMYAQHNITAVNAISNATDALAWLVNNRGDPYYGQPCCDWWWLLYQVFSALDIPVWALNYGVWGAVGSIGGNLALPIFGEMQPNSLFQLDLNLPANVDWEAATIPTRVSVVSSAPFRGGPFRLFAPEAADEVGWTMQAAAWALYFASSVISSEAAWDDWQAFDVSNQLLVAAEYLDSFDYVWCAAVSTVGMWGCDYHDGIVPAYSQVYPSSVVIWTGAENGPSHRRQKQHSDAWLTEALAVWSNVPYHPPPPPPPPPAPGPDRLLPFEVLYPYQSITSLDGRFSLIYQGDGNLVLYRLPDWTALWSSSTHGTSTGEVIMQGDGLLAIYDGPYGVGNVVWTSGTFGHTVAVIIMQDDGNLVGYAPEGHAVWWTGTCCH